MTEDEMVGWHHQLNGHESEQAPEDSEGQGSLVCCSPQGHKELDTTQQLNNNNKRSLVNIWVRRILGQENNILREKADSSMGELQGLQQNKQEENQWGMNRKDRGVVPAE